MTDNGLGQAGEPGTDEPGADETPTLEGVVDSSHDQGAQDASKETETDMHAAAEDLSSTEEADLAADPARSSSREDIQHSTQVLSSGATRTTVRSTRTTVKTFEESSESEVEETIEEHYPAGTEMPTPYAPPTVDAQHPLPVG